MKKWNTIVGSSVHPDTKEIIPFYMRPSGMVLFNMPLVFAVLFVRHQTPAFNAAMQWANQTYNAGMNYGNRNVPSSYTKEDRLRAYAGAVAVSCSLGFGVRKMYASQLAKLKGPRLIFANALIAYLAAAPAGALSAYLL